MSFDQGIDFRSTAAFVTDPTNCTSEIGTTANYPRTTPQGNTVGWEDAPSGTRNRSATIDARLAGTAFCANGTAKRYRVDLPAAGWYKVTLALGDFGASSTEWATVLDGTTVISHVTSGIPVNLAGGSFADACGQVFTTSSWPSGEISFVAFFSSGILRVRLAEAGSSGNSSIAHLRVQDATATSRSFNCGIDFRQTYGFVTDPTNCSPHLQPNIAIAADYPHINRQGVTCGWEQAPTGARDRSAAVDGRVAGEHFVNANTQATFRIDLPAAGAYQIEAAIGDNSVPSNPTVELFDSTTSLGALISNGSAGGGKFYDATGTLRTSAADWAANEQPVTESFSTTTLRLTCGVTSGATDITALAHVKVTQLTGFNGTSALTAALNALKRFAATLAGIGSLSSVFTKRFSATFAGTSSLSATISTSSGVTDDIAVTLAGTSTLSAGIVQTDFLDVEFDGTSELVVGGPGPDELSVALDGSSSLSAEFGITADLSGTSSLTASFARAQFNVELHGQGALTFLWDLGAPGARLSQIVNQVAYVGDGPPMVLSQLTIEVARPRSKGLFQAAHV